MTKKFLNISRQECLDSYQIVLDNSDRHFNVAKIIAEKEEYGIAIAHLILGTEELVKALIIYLDGEGLEIRKVKGVQKFFYQHTIRHFFSGIFLLASMAIKPIVQMAERFKELIHNPDARESMTAFETAALKNDNVKAAELTKEWGDKHVKQYTDKFKIYFDFWSDAENHKQRGFYVDYANGLLSPGQITKGNYLEAIEVTTSFQKECKELIRIIQNLQDIDKKVFFKAINQDRKLYKMLEDFISGQNR